MDWLLPVAVSAWLLVGAASHVYWVTTKYDYDTGHIFASAVAALAGPISFIFGWLVYGRLPQVIIRGRRR